MTLNTWRALRVSLRFWYESFVMLRSLRMQPGDTVRIALEMKLT